MRRICAYRDVNHLLDRGMLGRNPGGSKNISDEIVTDS